MLEAPLSRAALLLILLLSIAGCATAKRSATEAPPDAAGARVGTDDPLEGFNRAMFSFNDKLDRYALKPAAKGYRAVLPSPVRTGVSNFFRNLREPLVVINDVLQGKGAQAASDFTRFVVNTTLGLFGLFDVATHMNLKSHDEDFGQTLGRWGVGEGAYLVLPFFGPSSLRDGTGRIVDAQGDPVYQHEEKSTRAKLILLNVVDTRANLLEATDIIDQAAGEDPYAFVREAFRQRRRNLIYDGNPPAPPPPEFLFEDDPKPKPETTPRPPAP